MTDNDIQKKLEKASILLASGEFNKAYNLYKKIVKENDSSSEAYFGLAESSLAIPKLTVQEIASSYQKACDLDPDNPLYLATYGNFCFENGILKKAEDCFQKASMVDEENASIYLSDLATGYFHSAKNYQDHYPGMTYDDILITSMKYILMAFDLSSEKAKEIIDNL
ncbi:MAG: hypothetical protein QCI82_02770 [Candidatus Thermoplasmatota archaeon]|nr:hypothetical protein [Candidatus Thermoplasmatota archaeon]